MQEQVETWLSLVLAAVPWFSLKRYESLDCLAKLLLDSSQGMAELTLGQDEAAQRDGQRWVGPEGPLDCRRSMPAWVGVHSVR